MLSSSLKPSPYTDCITPALKTQSKLLGRKISIYEAVLGTKLRNLTIWFHNHLDLLPSMKTALFHFTEGAVVDKASCGCAQFNIIKNFSQFLTFLSRSVPSTEENMRMPTR
jgi:hypothetical protein